MSEKKNLDEFLRDTLNRLPNTPVGDFKKVENRLRSKNHQSILLLLLVPFVLSGLIWLGGFTEKDVYFLAEPHGAASQTEKFTTEESISPEAPKVPITTERVSKASPKNSQSGLVKTENDAVKKTSAQNPVPAVQYATRKPQTGTHALGEITPKPTKAVAQEPEEQLATLFAPEESVLPASNIVLKTETHAPLPAEIAPYDVRETSKVSVTLNVYPNYTFREFKINTMYQSQVNNRYEDIINASEKGGFAFNAGIDVRYHLGDNLFIGSGLGLIQTKINGSYNYEVSGEPVVDGNGNIYMYALFIEPFEVNQGIIQTYRFLQLPLHVSYQPWVSQKLRLIVEGGFSYIRFLSADGKTIDHQSLVVKELNTMHFNKDMASMDFKIGLTFYPNPQVAFGVEPTLMYFNSSIYASDFPVYVVPWSVGVNINVRLKLY